MSGGGSASGGGSSSPSRRDGVGLRSERGPVLGALMLSTGLVAIDATILATAVPSIVDDLGGFAQFPWLFSIYLLSQAVSVPIYAKLSDSLGRKPIILIGIGLFLAGSVFCGLAWSMPALIAFRALQGFGAGAVQPMAITIAGDIYTVVERATVQGYIASVWAISSVIGPTLGGRVGLHLALAEPALVDLVVLVSSTSGLEEEDERARRREADEEQATFLEREGLEAFADRWATLPLWDGDPPDARAAQREALAAGDAAGLAAALRGLGPGAVPAVGARLATLAAGLRVVVGGRDLRYRAIGTRLLGLAAQPAGEVVVADAGHGLLREAPAAVAASLCPGA